jgi:hypothetical protein
MMHKRLSTTGLIPELPFSQELQEAKESSLTQMLTFHSPTPGEPLVDGYGLGVVRFSPEIFNEWEVWGHRGNAPGYATGCFYLSDYGVSIGIMVNTHEGEAIPTVFNIMDIITSHLPAVDP